MLLTDLKKANMFSHTIMADVKNVNQHLHFSDNFKYSENLGMRTYSRFFNEVSQMNNSIHSLSFQSLHLRHRSFWFSKLSVTSPTWQLILQPFPRFTYVTAHSPTLPSLYLRHSSFSKPSFGSPTSQDFHLRHLASRPWLSHPGSLGLWSDMLTITPRWRS